MILYKKEEVSACNPLGIGGSTRNNALAQLSKFIGVRSVPGGFVVGVATELATLKENSPVEGLSTKRASGPSTSINVFTGVCKTFNLCRLLSLAETCKSDWFVRGPNRFGGGNLVSDTSVKRLSIGEECKWGRRTGLGAMGDGLVCRKDQRRKQQRLPRLNHHPWRRRIAEVKPTWHSLEGRWDRSGQ